MSNPWKIDMRWLADRAGLSPRTVCECAIGPIDISMLKLFCTSDGRLDGCRKLIGIEPHPQLMATAKSHLPSSAILIEKAIASNSGEKHRALVDNGGSSYLQGTWSPTPRHQGGVFFDVECIEFGDVDDGEIDILCLDCEGMEMRALSTMKSRPVMILIEIWKSNPFALHLEQWLESNGYVQRIATGPEGETRLYSTI